MSPADFLAARQGHAPSTPAPTEADIPDLAVGAPPPDHIDMARW
jgi:hypothetical protein